jgi:hypothetical protein
LLIDGHVHFASSSTVVFNEALVIPKNSQSIVGQVQQPPGLSQSTLIELANLRLEWTQLVHVKTRIFEINSLSNKIKAQMEKLWSDYPETELIVDDQLGSWLFPEIVLFSFIDLIGDCH